MRFNIKSCCQFVLFLLFMDFASADQISALAKMSDHNISTAFKRPYLSNIQEIPLSRDKYPVNRSHVLQTTNKNNIFKNVLRNLKETNDIVQPHIFHIPSDSGNVAVTDQNVNTGMVRSYFMRRLYFQPAPNPQPLYNTDSLLTTGSQQRAISFTTLSTRGHANPGATKPSRNALIPEVEGMIFEYRNGSYSFSYSNQTFQSSQNSPKGVPDVHFLAFLPVNRSQELSPNGKKYYGLVSTLIPVSLVVKVLYCVAFLAGLLATIFILVMKRRKRSQVEEIV